MKETILRMQQMNKTKTYEKLKDCAANLDEDQKKSLHRDLEGV